MAEPVAGLVVLVQVSLKASEGPEEEPEEEPEKELLQALVALVEVEKSLPALLQALVVPEEEE